jgi:hypothetical protein
MDVKAQHPEVRAFIRNQLNLTSSAEEVDLATMYDTFSLDLPIRPDSIFKDGGILYFVEIKTSAVSIDTIARMNLLRELWQRKQINPSEIQLIIAAKWFYEREERLAKELGIRLIKLPWALETSPNKEYPSSGMKITSEKSWKIISRLLKEKNSSIRQLALKEKVSYGWAHKVIGMLLEQNVVKKESGYITVADVKNLLNGVAWERPMKNLQAEEIFVNFSGSHVAGQEITKILKEQGIKFAFTTYTAGGLYTSYAFRQDAVYLYLKRETIDQFKENFSSEKENSIRAVIYAPDRDVFSDSRERESIVITSPSQTLLDLAGLGYSAMDLTDVMVERFAGL